MIERIWKNLLLANPKAGYTFLGVVEVFWGMWYINPILQNYLNSGMYPLLKVSHFDPPLILGLAAIFLGIFTFVSIYKTSSSTVFGILHIIFWSYVTISVAFEGLASSGMPLYIALVVISIIFYITCKVGEY